MPTIETARLIGTEPRADDLDELAELLLQPQMIDWLHPPALGYPLTHDRIARWIDNAIAGWEEHGLGYWIWRDRDNHALVGRGGLGRPEIDGEPPELVEVGWAITPARWGEGLGTETAHAAIADAFGRLGLAEVIAFTMPENSASRRVMEKCGFVYEREFVYKRIPHVLYRLRRGQRGALNGGH